MASAPASSAARAKSALSAPCPPMKPYRIAISLLSSRWRCSLPDDRLVADVPADPRRAMQFGANILISEATIDAATAARAAEAAGFDSLWVGEHSHIPTSERTPYGGPPRMAPRDFVPRMPDPFVVLSAAAAVTTTLKLGTFVCLVV